MVRLAEGLPIFLVPEERHVPTMGNDVIYDSRYCHITL